MKRMLLLISLMGASCAGDQTSNENDTSVTSVTTNAVPKCVPGNDDCCDPSPVILDLLGDGIHLSSAIDGVYFDVASTRRRVLIGWTLVDSDDAWLALDRNGNGTIDDGSELFGNFTVQPIGQQQANGFAALSMLDSNHDGVVSAADTQFGTLRLWRDLNHDGVSQPGELSTLTSQGVISIGVRPSSTGAFTDKAGNQFRFNAPITSIPGKPAARLAWDVWVSAFSGAVVDEATGDVTANDFLCSLLHVTCWVTGTTSPIPGLGGTCGWPIRCTLLHSDNCPHCQDEVYRACQDAVTRRDPLCQLELTVGTCMMEN